MKTTTTKKQVLKPIVLKGAPAKPSSQKSPAKPAKKEAEKREYSKLWQMRGFMKGKMKENGADIWNLGL